LFLCCCIICYIFRRQVLVCICQDCTLHEIQCIIGQLASEAKDICKATIVKLGNVFEYYSNVNRNTLYCISILVSLPFFIYIFIVWFINKSLHHVELVPNIYTLWNCSLHLYIMWNCYICLYTMWNCSLNLDAMWNCFLHFYTMWNYSVLLYTMWNCSLHLYTMWNCSLNLDTMWNCSLQLYAMWNCFLHLYTMWNCSLNL